MLTAFFLNNAISLHQHKNMAAKRTRPNAQAKRMGSAMKKAHSMTKEQIKPVKKTITVRVGYKKRFKQNLKKTMKLFGVK